MKLSQNDLNLRKKLYLVSAVSFAVLYSLCCFVISPLNVSVNSNIAFGETILPDLLYYLGKIAELAAIAVSYATIIYGIYRFSLLGSKGSVAIFLLATVCKYTANTLVSWLFDGGIPSAWLWDLINVLFYTLLEAIQLAVVLLFVNSILTRQKQKDKILSAAGKAIPVYPFRKAYDKENCLMRAAMAAAAVVFVSKIFGQLVNDVYYILAAGMPKEVNTVILMLVSYLSHALFGAICYVAVILTLLKLVEKPEK